MLIRVAGDLQGIIGQRSVMLSGLMVTRCWRGARGGHIEPWSEMTGLTHSRATSASDAATDQAQTKGWFVMAAEGVNRTRPSDSTPSWGASEKKIEFQQHLATGDLMDACSIGLKHQSPTCDTAQGEVHDEANYSNVHERIVESKERPHRRRHHEICIGACANPHDEASSWTAEALILPRNSAWLFVNVFIASSAILKPLAV